MDVSGISTKAYTSAAAAVDEDEKLKEQKEEKAAEEAVKTEKKEGDKIELSAPEDGFTDKNVEEKARNYIQNLVVSANLSEASKTQLQNYLNTFDVAKFVKSYGPFNSTAEISATLYAVTSGMVKHQNDDE